MGVGLIAFDGAAGADYTWAVATFGENLRRLRLQAKPPITQEELARRLKHANNSTVSKWERHALVPEPATILQVAKAINAEPWQLLENVITEYDKLRARQGLSDAPAKSSATRQSDGNKSGRLTSPVTDSEAQSAGAAGGVFSPIGADHASPDPSRLSQADRDLFRTLEDETARLTINEQIIGHAYQIIRLAGGTFYADHPNPDPRTHTPHSDSPDPPLREQRTGTGKRRNRGWS